jgi:signal transduction histidine kinase
VTLTPRRRVALACLLAVVLGYAAPSLARALNVGALCRPSYTPVACNPEAPAPCLAMNAPSSLCATWFGTTPLNAILVGSFFTAAAVASLVAASWAMRPLRTMVQVVSRMGPQNLGYRLTARGPREETRQLSDALDQMMDRIASGYEAQRRFAANASHELRTPLAVQRTLIEVSLDSTMSPDRLGLVATQLLRTNERNEQLIEGLLVLSETDQGLLARTPQRLDQIAAEVIAHHRDLAATNGVTLHAELGERTVDGERVLLERLVANLVQNAIKYNRADGDVVVTVADRPTLTVRNTGNPVPAEQITSLFEPFRRLGGERIHHNGGAGLGLTIVRSITEAHAGTVTARPNPGGGLIVEVDLPQGTP